MVNFNTEIISSSVSLAHTKNHVAWKTLKWVKLKATEESDDGRLSPTCGG